MLTHLIYQVFYFSLSQCFLSHSEVFLCLGRGVARSVGRPALDSSPALISAPCWAPWGVGPCLQKNSLLETMKMWLCVEGFVVLLFPFRLMMNLELILGCGLKLNKIRWVFPVWRVVGSVAFSQGACPVPTELWCLFFLKQVTIHACVFLHILFSVAVCPSCRDATLPCFLLWSLTGWCFVSRLFCSSSSLSWVFYFYLFIYVFIYVFLYHFRTGCQWHRNTCWGLDLEISLRRTDIF